MGADYTDTRDLFPQFLLDDSANVEDFYRFNRACPADFERSN